MLRQLLKMVIIAGVMTLSHHTATARPQAEGEERVVTHTIEKGEFLSHIAKKYNTTISKILELNEGLEPDKIRSGQKIRVPASAQSGSNQAEPSKVEEKKVVEERPAEPEFIEHTVAKGETFSLIVVKNRTTTVRILKLNPGLDPAQVHPGQKIKLPNPAYNKSKPTAPKPTTPPSTKQEEKVEKVVKVEKVEKVEKEVKAEIKGEERSEVKADEGIKTEAPAVESEPQELYHIVVSGDTMHQLARTYQTTISKIVELNPGLEPDKIRIGQKIRVK